MSNVVARSSTQPAATSIDKSSAIKVSEGTRNSTLLDEMPEEGRLYPFEQSTTEGRGRAQSTSPQKSNCNTLSLYSSTAYQCVGVGGFCMHTAL